jgi:hypothetical protein
MRPAPRRALGIAATSEHLLEELEGVISARVPLRQIVSTMREYRQQGVTRHEARSALESLRARARDEATEDRILEVMEIASGLCSRESTVWDD